MCSTSFIFACILRFLTPSSNLKSPHDGIYTGWFDGSQRVAKKEKCNGDTIRPYADGLSHSTLEGWYEFRCSCKVTVPEVTSNPTPLPEILGSFKDTEQPHCYEGVIRSYLLKNDGGNLSDIASNAKTKKQFDILVKSISTLYARMVAGDGLLKILKEMNLKQGMFKDNGLESSLNILVDSLSVNANQPLQYRLSPIPDDSHLLNLRIGWTDKAIRATVFSEVASVLAIDLHTHLLPPSHGALCLWGIDELLTYVCFVGTFCLLPNDFYI